MDVDAAGELCGHFVRQDLHVARQHDKIGPGLVDQIRDRGFLLVPGLFGHRQVVKRNFAEIEIGESLARMVGDNSGRDHFQLASAPAIEDVGQAMIGFRHQEHHASAAGAVAHLPLHAEAVRNRPESGLQRRQIDGEIGGVEHYPHEEVPGLDVVELLGIEDVLPVMGQERRYRGHDSGTVRTGESHDEVMIGHDEGLDYNSGGTAVAPCSIIANSLAPIPLRGQK